MNQGRSLFPFIISLPPLFPTMNALMKLRLVITLTFLFSTAAIALVFARLILPAVILFLLSYLFVFVLMIKLFLIRKL